MEQFYEAKIFTTYKSMYRMVFSEHQDISEIFNDAFVSVEPFSKDTDYVLIPTSEISMIKITKLPAGTI